MKNYEEFSYLDLLNKIVRDGQSKGDRTGTGTISLFGQMQRYNLKGFSIPLLTTKKIFTKSFIHETLWFISGSTDVKYLKDNDVSIWDSWVNPATAVYRDLTQEERLEKFNKLKDTSIDRTLPAQEELDDFLDKFDIPRKKLVSGSIGKGSYGAMWRDIEDTRIVEPTEWELYVKKGFQVVCKLPDDRYVVNRHIDQLQNAIDLLRTNPDSRRIVVHAFDNRQTDFCSLPPCHSWFQFWSREMTTDERISWNIDVWNQWSQLDLSDEETTEWLDGLGVPKRSLKLMIVCRSQDFPVGTPFNIAQYSLLAHMVAQCTGHYAEELIWVGGDTHVYSNQTTFVNIQSNRPPLKSSPKVRLDKKCREIDDFSFESIAIEGYDNFHPPINYPVSV